MRVAASARLARPGHEYSRMQCRLGGRALVDLRAPAHRRTQPQEIHRDGRRSVRYTGTDTGPITDGCHKHGITFRCKAWLIGIRLNPINTRHSGWNQNGTLRSGLEWPFPTN